MKTPAPKMDQAQPTFIWVTEKRVSEITEIALQTLRNQRSRGIGFPYYKLGRSVRYRLGDILSYMEARRVDPK